MKEHGCSEENAREILKERIRIECANYVRIVKEARTRTDLSSEVKRYVETMQYTLSGNLAWSTQCPRYNAGAKFNELQLLRAKYGIEKYPAMWPPKDATNGLSDKDDFKESLVNDHDQEKLLECINDKRVHPRNGVNGHNNESTKANGHKRKRNDNSDGSDVRMNGTNGVKKSAHVSQQSTDPAVLADVVSLALDRDLPELSDDVS